MVEVNSPYSNAIRVKSSIPTFMIELSKAIYLQYDGKTPDKDFEHINQILDELYDKLLED